MKLTKILLTILLGSLIGASVPAQAISGDAWDVAAKTFEEKMKTPEASESLLTTIGSSVFSGLNNVTSGLSTVVGYCLEKLIPSIKFNLSIGSASFSGSNQKIIELAKSYPLTTIGISVAIPFLGYKYYKYLQAKKAENKQKIAEAIAQIEYAITQVNPSMLPEFDAIKSKNMQQIKQARYTLNVLLVEKIKTAGKKNTTQVDKEIQEAKAKLIAALIN